MFEISCWTFRTGTSRIFSTCLAGHKDPYKSAIYLLLIQNELLLHLVEYPFKVTVLRWIPYADYDLLVLQRLGSSSELSLQSFWPLHINSNRTQRPLAHVISVFGAHVGYAVKHKTR